MKFSLNKLSFIVLLCSVAASIFIYYQRFQNSKTYKFREVSNEVFQYRVNINTAELRELDNLPGIGPSMAKRIIDYRKQNGPFQSLVELKKVKGIGDKTFVQIERFLTF